MAIQYSGGVNINFTWVSDGTRANLVTNILTQLAAAGWSTDVTTSATDKTMKTAATTNGSLQCRMRVYDPGSGNCARIKISNAAGTITQFDNCFLLPANGSTFRIIANKYQFFVFQLGSAQARNFIGGGTLYIPTFITPSTIDWGWIQGNGASDTDTTFRASFRSYLYGQTNGPGNSFFMSDSNFYELSSGAGSSAYASGGMLVSYFPNVANLANYPYGFCWHDKTLLVSEPLIMYASSNITDEVRVRGQLWDAMVVTEAFADSTVITLDGKNWLPITNNNTGSNAAYRGTLFHVVP